MIEKKLKILHLEDLQSDADLVRRSLIKGGVNIDLCHVENRAEFISALDNDCFDIILSDHSLPSFDSLAAMTILKERGSTIPFILITATISEEYAVEVMKLGASDYILKDRLQRLPSAIYAALEKYEAEKAHQQMIGQMIRDQALYKEAERVAHFGTWSADLLTGITIMSDAAYRILGYEPDEMDPSAVSFLDSIHPDDLALVQQLIGETIGGNEISGMDFRMKTQNGEVKHIHSEFKIGRDVNGVAISIIGFNQDVTKQKLSEMQIKDSETKYRHLFENNPMCMFLLDTDSYELLDVNEATLNHYGYTREEFLSMSASDLRPEEEKSRFAQQDKKVSFEKLNKKPWKHVKKDGTIIYVEIHSHPVEFNGKTVRLILANDVTQIKKANEDVNEILHELETSNKSHSAILDALPANIALLDSNGNIIAINNGWKSFADENDLQSPNYLVGVNYIDACKNSSSDVQKMAIKLATNLENVIKGHQQSFSMEYPCHAPDRYRWFKVEVAPLHNNKGAGAVVMHLDITDRKRAEIEAQQLNEQLYNSLEQLSDYRTALDQSSIVAITDAEGTITYANENFAKISKYSTQELIGQNHRLVNSGYHPMAFFKKMWDTIKQGRIWKGEIRNRSKDGSSYWVDTTILPFMDEHGKPYQYMSIRSDITERKNAEEKLQQLTQTLEKKVVERTAQLEQSMKELESFSYSVSHDLRAPLRIINGYSKLFMEEYLRKLDPTAIEYINAINQNAVQMAQLIEDLLNLSRLGLEAIEKTDVDMKMLADLTLLEYKNNNTYIPPSICVGDLPAARCSRNLMKQVWINLIGNAIKYSSKKEDPIIQISAYIENDETVYMVKDNGAGFDMRYADKLFGVFQRLHDRQDYEGTGVGLALVHRIITRHGGKVWAESKVGEGATFYFSLPN